MIPLLLAITLTVPHAKAGIAAYENAYWSKQFPSGSHATTVSNCRRRSAARVACVTYTRLTEPEAVTHITSEATARELKHGVIKIEPSQYGLSDTETVLGE